MNISSDLMQRYDYITVYPNGQLSLNNHASDYHISYKSITVDINILNIGGYCKLFEGERK